MSKNNFDTSFCLKYNKLVKDVKKCAKKPCSNCKHWDFDMGDSVISYSNLKPITNAVKKLLE